ncbi:MAG: DUF4388 domain-containing protein, partial [Deltaproteobacteria bacterium]|nr:DUF4388 domain-containing protein [Deltaproteobacteria bacterium]
MSVALRGDLKDFGIGEVFQLIGQQRKTGVLEFKTKRDKIRIRLDEGAVVSAAPAGSRPDSSLADMMVRCGHLTREQVNDLQRASDKSAQPIGRMAVSRGQLTDVEVEELEDLLTRETIFQVLRWTSGSFHFNAEQISHGRAVDALLGAEQILMDGMRMVDEWQSFADLVPSEATVFRRAPQAEAPRDDGYRHPEDARRVWALVDGRLPVRRIVDLSRLGTFDASRILAELHRNGAIQALDPGSVRRDPLTRRIQVERRALRGWILAAIPMFLLVLLAGLSNQVTAPMQTVQGLPIA